MNIIKKIKLFFLCKTAIKKLLSQKDDHVNNIGKRRDLNSFIRRYTRQIFKLNEDIRDVECVFYLKAVKDENSKQFKLVPILLYNVKVSCCTKLKIIINLGDKKYIKFRLFTKDKDEKGAEMYDIDTSFAVIKILLNKNKCSDGK